MRLRSSRVGRSAYSSTNATSAPLSTYGAMFAPDHRRTAAELARVCRPGGTIALASWTPEGFLGDLFRTVSDHVAPPPGLVPPVTWGTEQHLLGLFGDELSWRHRRRTFTFRFASADAFVGTFVRSYGPTLKAFGALDADAQAAMEQDLLTLARAHNTSLTALRIPSEYLEIVAVKA